MFCGENKIQEYWLFSPKNIYLWRAKKPDEKREEDVQTLVGLISAHRRSQGTCQPVLRWYVQTSLSSAYTHDLGQDSLFG